MCLRDVIIGCKMAIDQFMEGLEEVRNAQVQTTPFMQQTEYIDLIVYMYLYTR